MVIGKMICQAMILVLVCYYASSATPISGPLTDTLYNSGSPYEIVGDIYVPPFAHLIIEPAVVMNFQGNYSFHVNNGAVLGAIGTEADSIYFTCDTLLVPGGWGGIFFDTSGSGCIVQYCRIEFSKNGGIVGFRANPNIVNCHFTHNWPFHSDQFPRESSGISFSNGSHPIIQYNLIDNNFWAHIFGILIYNSSAEIIGNTITHLSGYQAIYLNNSYDVALRNNVIANNNGEDGTAIRAVYGQNLVIEGNLISNNNGWSSGEIALIDYMTNVIFRSNILSHNTALTGNIAPIFHFIDCDLVMAGNIIANNHATRYPGVAITGNVRLFANNVFVNNVSDRNIPVFLGNAPKIENCIFWNNLPPQIDSILNYIYCDIQGGYPGHGNIDTDPLFRDTTSGDYHLMSIACGDAFESPCIDAGSPLYYDDSLLCNWGLGTTLCDIGAYGGVSSYCIYDAGDVNGDGGANGIDVVYFVNYLKGGPDPIIYCNCANQPYFYPAADVNGNCEVNGLDVTYFVRFLKSQVPALHYCANCPPAGR